MNIPFNFGFGSFDSHDNSEEGMKKMLLDFLRQNGITEINGQPLDYLSFDDLIQNIQSDPQIITTMMSQVQNMFSGLHNNSTGEPVNWDLAIKTAHDTANTLPESSDSSSTAPSTGFIPNPPNSSSSANTSHNNPVTAEDRRQIEDLNRLAELWVDDSTAFGSQDTLPEAWNQNEWIDNTMPTWKQLSEPIATSTAFALTDALSGVASGSIDDIPEEYQEMFSGLLGQGNQGNFMGEAASMLNSIGGSLFAMQLGQSIGSVSHSILSTSDIGIPLTQSKSALLPKNIARMADELDNIEFADLALFIAIREAAYQRLFRNTPWLGSHILGSIQAYARDIKVGIDTLDEDAITFNPSDISAMQEAIESGKLLPEPSEEQKATLTHLETTLALVEGWVDQVTMAAAADMPNAAALGEIIRRRHAQGGPAEKTFSSLVGLELRPRKLREASELWQKIAESEGEQSREAIWAHPDLLPETEDLNSPEDFLARRKTEANLDDELAALLDGKSSDNFLNEADIPGHASHTNSKSKGTSATSPKNPTDRKKSESSQKSDTDSTDSTPSNYDKDSPPDTDDDSASDDSSQS